MAQAQERLEASREAAVFNLSSLSLSPVQLKLLGHGLKFIPVAAPQHSSTNYLKSAIHHFIRGVAIRLHFAHSRYNAPRSFLPRVRYNTWFPEEEDCFWLQHLLLHRQNMLSALDQYPSLPATTHLPPRVSLQDRDTQKALRVLQDDPNIVIQPADKNLGVCIMDKVLYRTLCFKHLHDTTTYQQVTNHFSSQVFARLRMVLANAKQLVQDKESMSPGKPTKLAGSLLQMQGSPHLKRAAFYVIPKLHKATLSSRPIVNTIDSPTFATSQFLHNYLFELVKAHVPTLVLSSTDVIRRLMKDPPLPGGVILTADVVSLYPNIPVDFGLACVEEFLNLYNRRDSSFIPTACFLPNDLLLALLRFVLTNNYFEFEGRMYLQVCGTAMGTPGAVVYANIVLYMVEKPMLAKHQLAFRFIDDLCYFLRTHAEAQEVVDSFQSQCPSLKLDAISIGQEGVFLDIHLRLGVDGSVVTKLYQKPLNKYQYLPPHSRHPTHVKDNMIVGEAKRYRVLCSKDSDFQDCLNLARARLVKRGYAPDYITALFQKCPERSKLLEVGRPRSDRQNDIGPLFFLHPQDRLHGTQLHALLKLPEEVTTTEEYSIAYHLGSPTMVVRLNPPSVRLLTRPRASRLDVVPGSTANPEQSNTITPVTTR